MIVLIFFLVYTIQTLINWFCILLDQIFFPASSKLIISPPVIITGVPRSGTTFMHRILAMDRESFTTFTLAELLFSPSLIQKHFFYLIYCFDKKINSPLAHAIEWMEKKLAGDYSKIHKYSLFQPDEDEISILNIFSSLYLLFLFPDVEVIRKYAQFDENLTGREKKAIMNFHTMMIRKHLYFHTRGKKSSLTYLAKSPAYISKMNSLFESFPGCKIIYMERNPLEIVPSFLSMTSAVYKIFNSPKTEFPLKEETIALLKTWLDSAREKLAKKDPGTYFKVSYNQFTMDPGLIIKEIYAHFGMKVSAAYEEILNCISRDQRTYKSLHKYSLDKIGLDAWSLQQEFSGFFPGLER